MRVDSPVDAEILEPFKNSVRVGPAVISPEEQQRVDTEVARLTALSSDKLEAIVRETLEIGGRTRLAAIAQISETNPVVSTLISDVRGTPGTTNMGRGDHPTDETFPFTEKKLGHPTS